MRGDLKFSYIHLEIYVQNVSNLLFFSQELGLNNTVPLERCRLVKYEEFHDSLECSFDGQDDELISEVLGGVRSSYKFDLLMEIRDEDKAFEVYKPGGMWYREILLSQIALWFLLCLISVVAETGKSN